MFRRRRVEVHAPPPERMKLILVVNAGLKMSKGKIAAQVGHASVSAALTARRRASHLLDSWLSGGQRKVCVKGRDADHLRELMAVAKEAGIATERIRDAGRTEIPAGSLTVVSIGPDDGTLIDTITGDLPLL